MTCYHGGKQHIGLKIAEIILSITGARIHYIEPFCGMLGVFARIAPLISGKAIAGDINPDLIAMWKKVQEGWLPPRRHYGILEYEKLKQDCSKARAALRGFVGHHYSFGGLYFRSYRFSYVKPTNIDTVIKRFQNMALAIQKAHFSHGDYTQFSKARGAVIYCDPPYNSTTCAYSKSFDSEKFLNWCENMTRQDNIVFVSEYSIRRANFIKVAELGQTRGSYKGSMNGAKESLFMCT